jgi:hypothetical protein
MRRTARCSVRTGSEARHDGRPLKYGTHLTPLGDSQSLMATGIY